MPQVFLFMTKKSRRIKPGFYSDQRNSDMKVLNLIQSVCIDSVLHYFGFQ